MHPADSHNRKAIENVLLLVEVHRFLRLDLLRCGLELYLPSSLAFGFCLCMAVTRLDNAIYQLLVLIRAFFLVPAQFVTILTTLLQVR